MLTPGIFTTQNYRIKVKHINEVIRLIPFGDVHRSSKLCSVKHWQDFLKWAKTKDRTIYLGMGDYDDLASTSERSILLNEKLHEDSKYEIENLFKKNVDRLCSELSFMRGNLVGLVEGNHYGVFPNKTTTTQKMCELLGCKYLGVSSFIRLTFIYGTAESSIDIWAHHGKGAARLVGGSINRVQQMAESAEAHIFIMGHDHKKGAVPSSKLHLVGTKGKLTVKHKKQLYVRSGSFLKGYVENEASYIVDAAMNPTDLGVVKIELTPKRDGNRSLWIDIHASV
jgi:UDP-2,3-diacylglucosamine pyrophosphatase LpxH